MTTHLKDPIDLDLDLDDIPAQPERYYASCPWCGQLVHHAGARCGRIDCPGPPRDPEPPAAQLEEPTPTPDQYVIGAVRALEALPTDARWLEAHTDEACEAWGEVADQLEEVGDLDLLACLRSRLGKVRDRLPEEMDSDLEAAAVAGSLAEAAASDPLNYSGPRSKCAGLEQDCEVGFYVFDDGSAVLSVAWEGDTPHHNLAAARLAIRQQRGEAASWGLDLERHARRAGDAAAEGLRHLLTPGERALTLEQTHAVRADLLGWRPTTRTAHHDVYVLEVELEGRGEGEVRITLPRDEARAGVLVWTPVGEWIEEGDYSQEREPEAVVEPRSNGGRELANALIEQAEKIKARKALKGVA